MEYRGNLPPGPGLIGRLVVVGGATVAFARLRPQPPAPEAQETQFLRTQYRGIAALASALLLLALVCAAWLARQWVRPLAAVQAATARIARGELDVRVPVERGDEIGDVVRNVNAMAESLQRIEGARRRWLADLLLDYLQAEVLPARAVANGLAAVEEVRRARPSLVLLELMLPGLDGIGVCRAVRGFSDVPIIMLTARVDEVDRLLGLDTGADDCVCKPFSPREVMARVKAQLRRAEGRLASTPPLRQIDDDKLRIRWPDLWLPLTVIEFRMLRLLLQQPGRVFSRAQRLDSMHADEREVSDRAVDSHVRNLRRKTESGDPGFEGIGSVYGVGYRFDPPDLVS